MQFVRGGWEFPLYWFSGIPPTGLAWMIPSESYPSLCYLQLCINNNIAIRPVQSHSKGAK